MSVMSLFDVGMAPGRFRDWREAGDWLFRRI